MRKTRLVLSNERSFDDAVARLDEIVEATRSKATSLEDSLDLLDEAVDLWLGAVDIMDDPAFTPDDGAARPGAGMPSNDR